MLPQTEPAFSPLFFMAMHLWEDAGNGGGGCCWCCGCCCGGGGGGGGGCRGCAGEGDGVCASALRTLEAPRVRWLVACVLAWYAAGRYGNPSSTLSSLSRTKS